MDIFHPLPFATLKPLSPLTPVRPKPKKTIFRQRVSVNRFQTSDGYACASSCSASRLVAEGDGNSRKGMADERLETIFVSGGIPSGKKMDRIRTLDSLQAKQVASYVAEPKESRCTLSIPYAC